MKTHADVLLVTVTDVETRAVFDAFCGQGKQPPPQPIGDKNYHNLGIINGASVWHVRSEMGASAAQQTITDAIVALSPGAVVMTGIAFGMDETKQSVGDVLVSQRLMLYEPQRVGTKDGLDDVIPRGPRPDASAWLLDCFRNAQLSWKEARVRFGVVLTGLKLVDNLDFREQLRALEPEAIGGDMEGGGLYIACHDAKVDWILVKAICDWADGKKREKKGERQRLAAANAAALVLHTLKIISLKRDPITGDPGEPTDDELLQAFTTPLRTVADDCSKLATRGLSLGGDPHQKPLRLAHVYVSLDTKTPHPSRKEKLIKREEPVISPQVDSPLSALEALFNPQARRVVLVGEPGSGKSTFLQYVTLCLADQLCAAPGESSHLADLPVPDLIRAQRVLPLRVLLRDFAPSLNAGKPGTSKDVETFLLKLLEDHSHADAAAKLPALLMRGLAFVQFDGLDEVPKSLLPAVRQAITAFAEGEYQKCRVAVTCRTESYKKQEFKLASFPAPHEIAPLPAKQRAQFIHDWYQELEEIRPEFKGEGAGCAVSLLSAIATERLREMAGNPFFLTAMAALHRPEKPLPDTSAELMHQLVNSVLEEARKRGSGSEAKGREPELALLLKPVKEGIKVLRLRLEAIAYKARDDRQDRASRFVDRDLLRARLFLDKNVNDEWVDKLLDALLHRAGLLQSADGENFEFAYRFEEFLAGCHLANRDAWVKTQPSFVTRVRNLLKHQGDYARQVVIWAAGVNAHVQIDRSTVRELVSDLTPRTPVADAASLTNLELAADIARDAGMEHWQDEDVPDTSDTVSRLRVRLEEVRDGVGCFEAKARSRAASAIGRLGDHRPGVQLKNGLPDLADWILIPTGKFPMGCTEAEARYPDEKPQFSCGLITQPYRISRYPITVEQYQAFVKADGYRDNGGKEDEVRLLRWWTPDGLKWKRAGSITGPQDSDPVFQTPNHPRVGVSWFEAVAFCRWLTEELERKGELKHGKKITLPTEAQWERAARHTDGRTFPWGSQEECPQRCNMGDTGIGHTAAVGLFPSGDAECGAADMAGNVWEWCRTKWRNDYEDYEQKVDDRLEGSDTRVLRGGSFNNDRDNLRCANRNNTDPDNRDNNIGFRVVVAGGSAC